MLRARTFLFVFVLCSFLPATSRAVQFAAPSSFAVGTTPSAVVVADFNGDGKLDLAVLNLGSNNVSILLGNGDGTFQAAKNSDAGTSPSLLLSADFNGDGKPDLAVLSLGNAGASLPAQLRILFGNGDGSFQSPVSSALNVATQTFAAGDFSGDHKADLIIGKLDSTTSTVDLQILIGNGDGSFKAPASIPTTGPTTTSVAIADFDKDGKLDLAIGVSGGVQVFKGQGDGTFLAGPVSPLTLKVNALSVVDINGDGTPDLFADARQLFCFGSIIRICNTTQRVGVLLGNGDGSFATEQIFAAGSSGLGISNFVNSVNFADFNGDGKLDVAYRLKAAPSIGTVKLEVRLGKGDGTFAAPILLPDPGTVAAARDLNGDNLADLLVPDSANGNVNVLLNDSPTSGTDLAILSSSASPEPVGAGTTLTYQAGVQNEGPQNASSVTFTDTLPANVTFVSATASQGSCTQASGTVTCNLGALADATDAQITITVTPTATGTITNNMHITGAETDSVSANNSASQVSTVVPVFTLTITKSGNGTGTINGDQGINGPIDCGTSCSVQFLSGTPVNLSANPDPGSLLQSWGAACSGTAPGAACSITMDSNKTASATFVLGISLNVTVTGGSGTVSSSDGFISCTDTGGACSSLSLPGSSVSLTAAPATGFQFSTWSGACSGSDPNVCSVALNSNQSVTATFSSGPTFSLTPASATLAAGAGSTITDMLTFTAQNGFTGTINLTCSVAGPAPIPSCSLAPSSIVNSGTSTLSVMIPGNALMPVRIPRPSLPPAFFNLAALSALAVLLSIVMSRASRRRGKLIFAASALSAVAILAACGGGSSGPKQPQSYNVTVTATAGSISKTSLIQVTVR